MVEMQLSKLRCSVNVKHAPGSLFWQCWGGAQGLTHARHVFYWATHSAPTDQITKQTHTHKKQNIWKALNFRYIYKWYFWKYKHYSKMNFTSGQEMQPIWYHRAHKTPSMISSTIDTGCHSACLWSRRQTQEDRKAKLAPGYLAQDQSGIHQSLSWKRNRILPRFWLFVVLLPGNLKSHV